MSKECYLFLKSVTQGIFQGLGVGLGVYLCTKLKDCIDKRKIYNWLVKNTAEKNWRSTRTISSFCNFSENRVRELCSSDKRICRDVKNEEKELWSLVYKVRS
jgi:hypothetical protein